MSERYIYLHLAFVIQAGVMACIDAIEEGDGRIPLQDTRDRKLVELLSKGADYDPRYGYRVLHFLDECGWDEKVRQYLRERLRGDVNDWLIRMLGDAASLALTCHGYPPSLPPPKNLAAVLP